MPMTSSIRKQLGQDIECDAVGRIIERWNEHDSVGDVEIGIAGRQSLAVEDDWPGHGQLDDAEGLPILVACVLQPAKIICKRFVVRFVGVVARRR